MAGAAAVYGAGMWRAAVRSLLHVQQQRQGHLYRGHRHPTLGHRLSTHTARTHLWKCLLQAMVTLCSIVHCEVLTSLQASFQCWEFNGS